MARRPTPSPNTQLEPVRRFAQAFTELIKSTGMTLKELEKKLRISDSQLSRYKRGETLPTPVLLSALHTLAKSPPFPLSEIQALLEAAGKAPEEPTPTDQNSEQSLSSEQPAGRSEAEARPRVPLGRLSVIAAGLAGSVILGWGIYALYPPADAIGADREPDIPSRSDVGGRNQSSPSASSTPASRYQICADSLTVRSLPAAPSATNPVIGVLERDDSFDIISYSRDARKTYAYGFAHGKIGKRGWVVASPWLCKHDESSWVQ